MHTISFPGFHSDNSVTPELERLQIHQISHRVHTGRLCGDRRQESGETLGPGPLFPQREECLLPQCSNAKQNVEDIQWRTCVVFNQVKAKL